MLWDFSDTAMTFDNPAYLFDGTEPSPPPSVTVGPGIGKSGGNAILNAKKAGETISFPFPFTSSLSTGETISSATSTCTVWSGTDPNASLMVSSAPIVSGGIVYQAVNGGVEGNIYVVAVSALTSLNQMIEQDAFMAIV